MGGGGEGGGWGGDFSAVSVRSTSSPRSRTRQPGRGGAGRRGPGRRLMQRFAAWTNLSETTFVLPPEEPAADYRVRIFTPSTELPFAGHPRSAAATPGSRPAARRKQDGVIVQECAAGLVPVRACRRRARVRRPAARALGPRRRGDARPGRSSSSASTRAPSSTATGSTTGPAGSASCSTAPTTVLRLRPGSIDLDVGVVGPHPPGSPQDVEVRAFFRGTARPGRTRRPEASTPRSPSGCSGAAGSPRRTRPGRGPPSVATPGSGSPGTRTAGSGPAAER